MTDTPLDTLLNGWTSMALAPQKLWQSFNNGWSFGNVTISSQNSSAPETEQAIVAVESYGRQIGKLMDAVDLLIKREPDWEDTEAFAEVDKLKARIEGVKRDMAVRRIDQLRGDLATLRASDDPADTARYDACLDALRRLLDEIAGKAKPAGG